MKADHILFEGGTTADVVVYTYDPVSIGWKPVTTTGLGFDGSIKPGQGFNVKFSQAFYDDILNNANAASAQFGLAEAKE